MAERDLFSAEVEPVAGQRQVPLAARMRPRTLDEFFGQEEIVGPGRLLRRVIQADQLSSVIFYGPPGTGKTLLAKAVAKAKLKLRKKELHVGKLALDFLHVGNVLGVHGTGR